MKKLFTLAIAVFSASVLVAGETWFVDDDWYGRDGDGTEVAPFGTIQDAVDAATAGDTICVAEGVYDQGGRAYYDAAADTTYGLNRVLIDKSLTIVGAGRGKSVILGAHDADPTGCGPDAVRCVMCDPAVSNVRVEGFTLRGGGTHAKDAASSRICTSGGGFYAISTGNKCLLADSTIENCRSVRGGGAFGAVLVRTLIGGCSCSSMGGAVHTCQLWACIVVGNGSSACTIDVSSTMMTTLVSNRDVTYGVYEQSKHCNGIFIDTTKNDTGLAANCTADYCVFGAQPEARQVGPYSDTCVFDVEIHDQILSPATGDFRTLAGSAAATSGSADAIAAFTAISIPEADKYLDFFKNPVPKTGVIPCGAVQETAVAASGCYVIATDGFCSPLGAITRSIRLWARTETYPAQIRFAKDGLNRPIYCHTVGPATSSNYRPTEMDGSVVLTMPPIGVTATGEVLFAQAELYVDPENGKDDDPAYDGSSWAKAYRSVTKAGNSVTQTRTIVHCAAGDYTEANQGSIVMGGHNARIGRTSSTSYSVCYKGAGAGKSVVYGTADPEHLDDGEYGCGPNACCGVYLPASGDILQGFTIRDGHSSNWSEDVVGRDGGNVYAVNSPIVADCVIADGVARRGGAIQGGAYVARCQIIGNRGYNGTLRGGHRFVSCYFRSNKTSIGSHLYDESVGTYNCTYVYGDGGGVSLFYGQKNLFNSVYLGNEASSSTYDGGGNVYWGMSGTWVREGCVKLDPAFCDASTEPTLYCFSEAFDKGLMPTAENFGTNWWKFASTDLDGNLLQYAADGKILPGCRHTLASAALVEKPVYGSTEAALTNRIDIGTPLMVAYSNGAKPRPFTGIIVNGVTNLTDSVSLPAPDGMAGQCYQVSFLANGTNWYVNAAAEDDSGDGFTPETAKKTLKGIFADSYVLAGDCVHAAPGEYKDGAMCTTSLGFTGAVSNRVEIAEGMTLVSDAGAAETFIVGGDSPETGTNTDSSKRGPGAVKCAYLAKNATLKGFTIVGGRSASAAMGGTTYPSGKDYEGGGVYCSDNTSAVISDCVITNCAAIRSGAVYKGLLVNCRIVRNISSGGNLGAGGEQNACVGCYLGPQVNDHSSFRQPKQIDNCTLDGIAISYGAPSGGIRNSLLINLSDTSSSFSVGVPKLENCVFDQVSWANLQNKYASGTWTDCKSYSTEDLKVGACGRPLKGSPLIDKANGALAEGYVRKLTDADADGSQRVYNAALDIGAFEYDWRDDFAAAIDAAAQVTLATPNVAIDEATGRVKIPGGEAVQAVFCGTAGRKAMLNVRAVADGELSVSRAGEPLATVTAAQGETPVRYVSTGSDAFDFSYAGAGYGLLGMFTSKMPAAFYLK